MKQQNLKTWATCLCSVCLALFFVSCSSDLDIAPQVHTEDPSIKNLVSLNFDQDKVRLDSDVIHGTNPCEENYELLDNGDYAFNYIWPFQTARVVVHNTEKCQFGGPSEPSLKFHYRRDNVYEGKFEIELIYVLNGEIKTSILSGNFTVIED